MRSRATPDGQPFGPAWQIATAATDDELNDVSGDCVVYTAYESTTSSRGTIMLYRISTRQSVALGQAEVAREARIHGNNVVWVEGAFTQSRIMWYDLSWLGTEREAGLVAGPVPSASRVAIGSRYIVWAQYSNFQYDIWGFDLVSRTRFQITRTSDTDETQPATSGEWIVWQSQQHGAERISIEAMNRLTSEVRSVAAGGAYHFRPSIEGDFVTWESTATGNYDVFLYRLSDRRTFQVSTHVAHQYLNDVFGNKVTFVDLRNGS